VAYKGQPLPSGIVTFHGDFGQASGSTGEDGTYSVSNLRPGSYKVTVKVDLPPPVAPGPGKTAPPKGPPGGGPGEGKADGPRGKLIALPQKYANPDTTPLSFVVQPGKQTFNVELD